MTDGEPLVVRLDRGPTEPTPDQALWVLIRNRTKAISFERFGAFMDNIMCNERDDEQVERTAPTREALRGRWQGAAYRGVDAYQILKASAEAFLMQECGLLIEDVEESQDNEPGRHLLYIASEEARRTGRPLETLDSLTEINQLLREDYLERLDGELSALPYHRRIIENLRLVPLSETVPPGCYGILRSMATGPCLLELIWSYWHEEGMLAQAINVLSLRFQNKRSGARDPLARFELDALRPLNNLLWGFIEDEPHRLSLARRAYEYDHHYGVRLVGKAVPELEPADSRSKFLEAFHNVLAAAAEFYTRDDDTTVRADGFPVLNALRELHIILAFGAHNQFGDLPWTARVEMLIMEWLLARPEMREFLAARVMVPYQEPWMGAVDAMNQAQGWRSVSVTHFRDLGVFGEQLLLSVRYGNWVDVVDPTQGANWARYWRPEVQGYIHAYRAVSGVDLVSRAPRTPQLRARRPQPSSLVEGRAAGQFGASDGAMPGAATRVPGEGPRPR